jgi:23S rRNA (pseudouridine1915-N3)-methyltransferase
MNIRIITIGKDKKGEYARLIGHYTKQLPWKVELLELVPKKNHPTAAERMREEAKLLEQAAEGCEVRIAMDERGKLLSSPQFAQKLEGFQQQGQRNLAFFIGGADGLEPALRASCQLSLAFGPMVWPHQMVRLMLAEQLYRAHAILQGHPYHRGDHRGGQPGG